MTRRNRRLVLCFDGTWNSVIVESAPSNVVKLASAISTQASNGTDQIVYYNSGVGSGGPVDRFLGGAFGLGLKSNVQRGLTFLALNYQEGDEIYLFGYSRGAYTARALAGIIGRVGIPYEISRLANHWSDYCRLGELNAEGRRLGSGQELDAVKEQIRLVYAQLGPTAIVPTVQCVGVWDTVGAYGIPKGYGPLSLVRRFTSWSQGFRDTQLGSHIKLALHAVALDERRRTFEPTFWTRPHFPNGAGAPSPPTDQTVEQVWFSGTHANVGGGYADAGLSDLALVWMIARVAEETGLEFDLDFYAPDKPYFADAVWPCSAATLYRSNSGWLYRMLGGRAREVLPQLLAAAGGTGRRPFERINERVHWSVMQRSGWSGCLLEGGRTRTYRPVNLHPASAEFTSQTRLERTLLSRIRGAHALAEKCPMLLAKQPCKCLPAGNAFASPPPTAAGERVDDRRSVS
jgi:hypothetical protein